jgi:hypothetical protein
MRCAQRTHWMHRARCKALAACTARAAHAACTAHAERTTRAARAETKRAPHAHAARHGMARARACARARMHARVRAMHACNARALDARAQRRVRSSLGVCTSGYGKILVWSCIRVHTQGRCSLRWFALQTEEPHIELHARLAGAFYIMVCACARVQGRRSLRWFALQTEEPHIEWHARLAGALCVRARVHKAGAASGALLCKPRSHISTPEVSYFDANAREIAFST